MHGTLHRLVTKIGEKPGLEIPQNQPVQLAVLKWKGGFGSSMLGKILSFTLPKKFIIMQLISL